MNKHTEAEVQAALARYAANVIKQAMVDAVDAEEAKDALATFDDEAARFIKIAFGVNNEQ